MTKPTQWMMALVLLSLAVDWSRAAEAAGDAIVYIDALQMEEGDNAMEFTLE